jgi:transposase-like protein
MISAWRPGTPPSGLPTGTVRGVPAQRRDDDRRRAVDLYQQNDRTVDDIADEIGASRSTVYSWLSQAGVTGRQWRAIEALDPDLREHLILILANQEEFKDDIRSMVAALDALRAEQMSSAGGWMEQLREARHSLDQLNATMARLTGAVETLVSLQQPPPPPAVPRRRTPGAG